VDEIRAGEAIDLLLRESRWPYPYFAGRARAAEPKDPGVLEVLAGLDWQHRPVTLTRTASNLIGPHAALSLDVRDSAFERVAR
jgi:hypothetical protein